MTFEGRTALGLLQGVCFLLILITGMMLVGCGEPPEEEGLNPADRIWAEIIPEEGTVTGYGILLALDNTQQFIDWYNSIALSAEEQAMRDAALSSLVAPCCDDYPMSTCCCECNLARSVWGLSAYLITEKGYEVGQVQEASSQWLHFIRPDYYVASALVEEGINPRQFGFTTEDSCYTGGCNLPFYSRTSSGHLGGCGGMEELVLVEMS